MSCPGVKMIGKTNLFSSKCVTDFGVSASEAHGLEDNWGCSVLLKMLYQLRQLFSSHRPSQQLSYDK